MAKSQVMPWERQVECADCEKVHKIGECESNFDRPMLAMPPAHAGLTRETRATRRKKPAMRAHRRASKAGGR